MIELKREWRRWRHGGNVVHESVREDRLAAARHASFILSRLAGAAISAIGLMAYLAFATRIEPVVVGALSCMMLPAVAALMLMRTGALALAHLISASLFGVLVAGVAAATGGLASFVAPWLLVVPVEAALSGSRRVVAVVLAGCVAAASALALLGHFGALPVSLAPEGSGTFHVLFGLGGALVYAGMLAATIEYHFERSDTEVQDSQERYRLLAQNATDMITRHALNGDVLFVSDAAPRLVGSGCAALMGGGLEDLVHMDDRHAYAGVFAKAAETGAAASVEFRLATTNGASPRAPSYRWVELNCRPISDPKSPSGPREIVAVTRDITGRRHRQEELRQARDAAEQASRAKSHFLANMSHELRTPLNSVIGFAELLERDMTATAELQPKGEYAALIRQSGEHLLGVVNDLLDLSRIESGTVTLMREPVDLNEVARHCRAALQAQAQAGSIEVVLQGGDDELVLDADRKACTQIMLNLMSNAIKFSRPGGRVFVSTRCDAGTATIAVRDEGVGIAPELVGRLGQPFIQGDNAYSRTQEGVGLGLSIVKGLARYHDGVMRIESTQGVGTCVTVTLPKRDDHPGTMNLLAKGAAGLDAAPPII